MPVLLNGDDAVLVIVDVQERLLPAIHDSQRLLENISLLIKAVKILGIPIILTEHYPSGLGPTADALKALLGHLKPIEKISFGCFGEPNFVHALEKLGKKNVLVCGMETHVCIYQTVFEGLDKYKMWVISDAVSSRTAENKVAGIDRMRGAGAEIVTCEMLILEILKSAGSPKFKQILALVK